MASSVNPTAPAIQPAFQQLGTALQAGDLTAAQAAYRSIQQNASQQSTSKEKATAPASASAKERLAELGEAVRADTLSAVQQAVSPAPRRMAPGTRAAGAYAPVAKPSTSAATDLGGLLNAQV